MNVKARGTGMLAAGFIALAALFAAMYTIPALTADMAAAFRTPRSTLQGAFALWGFAVAVVGPIAGAAVDRYGLRRVLILGMGLVASSLLALAGARATWHVYAALILLSAPGHSLTYIGILTAAGHATQTQRGRTLGISGAGIGVGLTVLLPIAVWSSSAIGWRGAFLALAVVIGAAGAVVIFLTSSAPQVLMPTTLASPSPSLLGSAIFPLLFLGGIAIGVMDEALYQHLVPYLTATGFDTRFAALALGGLSLGYVGGQGLGGLASDRWGRRLVGLVGAGWFALATAALCAGFGSGTLLLGVALISGLGLGISLAVRNAVLADCFEGSSLGRATGLYQWAYAIGGAAIGWGGALLADAFGSYTGVLACAVASAVLWAVCLHLALVVRARHTRETPA